MRNGFVDDDAIRVKLMVALNRGTTRDELAKQLGISKPFLSQFLNRSRPHASAVMLTRLGYDLVRYYKRAN